MNANDIHGGELADARRADTGTRVADEVAHGARVNGRRSRRLLVGSLATTVGAGVFAVFPGTALAATPSNSSSAHASASPQPSSSPQPSGSGQPSNPACTPSVFSQAQQKVEADLAGRVTQLDNLLTQVNQPSGHLSPGDKQTLENDISGFELPGIQGLQAQVQQDTTCAQLWAAAHSMVFDYRVYVVMTPQTDLTIAADDETFCEGRFVALEPVLAAAIQNAKAHGKDVTAAETAFDDLKSQVTTAQSETNGLSAQMLAQTPHGYPANAQVFLGARTSEFNARNDLHVAYTDAEQIRADLQS
jgi:hypothetical protein